jgi:hypothetical protein
LFLRFLCFEEGYIDSESNSFELLQIITLDSILVSQS